MTHESYIEAVFSEPELYAMTSYLIGHQLNTDESILVSHQLFVITNSFASSRISPHENQYQSKSSDFITRFQMIVPWLGLLFSEDR